MVRWQGQGARGKGCVGFWEGRLQLTLKAVNVTRGLLCCAPAAWVSCVLCTVCCVLCVSCVWAAMDAGGGAHGTGPLPKPPEPSPGPAPQPPPGVEHQGTTTVTRACSLSKALNASLPLLEDWVTWMGPDASLPALKGREGQQDPRLALGAYIDAEVLAMGAVTQRGSRLLEMCGCAPSRQPTTRLCLHLHLHLHLHRRLRQRHLRHLQEARPHLCPSTVSSWTPASGGTWRSTHRIHSIQWSTLVRACPKPATRRQQTGR